jgi:hypothetical protein
MSKVNLVKAFYKFTPYRIRMLWGRMAIKVCTILDPDYSESYLLINDAVVAKLMLDKKSSEITLTLDFDKAGYRGRKVIAEVLDNIVKGAEKYLGTKLDVEVTLVNNSFLMIVRYDNSKVMFKAQGSEMNTIFVNGNLRLLAKAKELFAEEKLLSS